MRAANAIVFGAPIYFSDITVGLVTYIERFCFPYTTYSTDVLTFCSRPIF